ncbi:MAG TPA: hypothetical protein VGQ34_05250 [Sphingomicrobium sp.]|nr:hypothetical protein [Sphingomicrobium sp.]
MASAISGNSRSSDLKVDDFKPEYGGRDLERSVRINHQFDVRTDPAAGGTYDLRRGAIRGHGMFKMRGARLPFADRLERDAEITLSHWAAKKLMRRIFPFMTSS